VLEQIEVPDSYSESEVLSPELVENLRKTVVDLLGQYIENVKGRSKWKQLAV
jgi:hypothetical protein